MSCEFAHLDAVYVLGSLSAAERAEYERHLPGCAGVLPRRPRAGRDSPGC